MNTINPQNAKFVAVVNNVKELRLLGTANLDFWNKQLAGKPFQPVAENDTAEITIAATSLVWKGFRFNELTICLAIAEKNNPNFHSGYFLLHAFNSNRFFAFCERAFFSTPYYSGNIKLKETMPFSMGVVMNDQFGFKAEMDMTTRPFTEVDENWEGALFLPSHKAENYFIAKLSGQSRNYPFLDSDKIELKDDKNEQIFDLLVNSGFAGKEWRIRQDAFHAKSKTYRYKGEN